MPWARLDDTFHVHTKVQDALDHPSGLGAAAIGLWTLALSRSYLANVNRPLVLFRECRRLVPGTDADALAAVLVETGLWDPSDDGYLIHDWAQYRPPFDNQEARRLGGLARAAKAPRKGGKFAPGTVDNPVDNDQQEPAAPAAPGDLDQQHLDQQHQVHPSRPDPSRIGSDRPEGTHRGSRGKRAPAGEPAGRPKYLGSAAWDPFLDAWGKRFRLPPTEGQAEALWEAVDAYPGAAASFVLDCPADTKASAVVASVLERFHAIRADALAEAARQEVEADAWKRSVAIPRKATPTGPVPVSAVLDDLPM